MGGERLNTRYGKFAPDFVEERLTALCDPNAGIQTGPFGSQLHQEDYVPVGTPIITVEHLGENQIHHENLPLVSDKDKNRLSKYMLREGDIVFSRVGSVDRRAMGKIEMIDINKQVQYWIEGSKEDWEVAQDLLKRGRVRHSLFLGHLALEKMLKAHVCRTTQELAPRTHNLVRLAEIAGIHPTSDQVDILAEMNAFNVEGRYPESLQAPPNLVEGEQYLNRAKEVYKWLKNRI